MLSQVEPEAITALDPSTGNLLWRLQRKLIPDPPGGRRYSPPLACPPQLTRDGKLVLFFGEAVYAVNPKNGQTLWLQRHSRPMQRMAPPMQCGAVTLDSGVVAISGRAKTISKLDSQGNIEWTADLPLDGAAVAPPQISATTGDVLVRLAGHVACFDPGGHLKWTKPLGQGEDVPSVVDGVDEE